LPKKVPEPRLPPQVPGTSSEASSGGVPQPGQPQPGARQPDLADRIINEVLGTFLGGRW
jgi:penicillin-binding protein 1A